MKIGALCQNIFNIDKHLGFLVFQIKHPFRANWYALDLPDIVVVLDDLSIALRHQGEHFFTIQRPLPPPAGYASWFDYAVEAFSTRQAWLESLWETWVDDTAVELDREEIRESARLELQALRKAAAAAAP